MTQDFQISTDIYALELIQEAIEDFSDVTEIIFNKGVLSISGDSQDETQEMFHEFMNYILSL